MSQKGKRIYYDLTITNDKHSNNADTINADFDTQFNSPLIENPEEYDMMVQKFSIDINDIPIMIPELVQPQLPNDRLYETIYNVYLKYNDVFYTCPLYYRTQNETMEEPPPLRSSGQNYYINNKHPYFWIYSYDQFILMINDALEAAYTQTGAEGYAPFFTLDHSTQLITLHAQKSIFSRIQGEPPLMRLYINGDLVKYLGAFNGKFCDKSEDIEEYTFRFNIYELDNMYLKRDEQQSDTEMLKMTQEYSCLTHWNICDSIIFISDKLPITKEYFNYNSTIGLLYEGENKETYKNMSGIGIVSIFYPITNDGGDIREKVIYSNTNITNSDLITMNTNTPIRELDIKIFWADKYNNLYRLKIYRSRSASIRLCFIHK